MCWFSLRVWLHAVRVPHSNLHQSTEQAKQQPQQTRFIKRNIAEDRLRWETIMSMILHFVQTQSISIFYKNKFVILAIIREQTFIPIYSCCDFWSYEKWKNKPQRHVCDSFGLHRCYSASAVCACLIESFHTLPLTKRCDCRHLVRKQLQRWACTGQPAPATFAHSEWQ